MEGLLVSSSTLKVQRPRFTCHMKDMNYLKLFLISVKDVLSTEQGGRDVHDRMDGWEDFQICSFPVWIVTMSSYLIYLTGVQCKNKLSLGKGTSTYCNLFFLQSWRIYTRESWHWKIWFATVSKLRKAWSSWLHERYFLWKQCCSSMFTYCP